MPPRAQKSTSGASGLRWRAAVILAAGALVYANNLSGPFLFDDENSIVNNASIRSLDTALSPPRDTPVAGRPVVNVAFALNYAAGGLDVRGYHVANIAIHLGAALLLFGVVRRTLLQPKLADRFGAASASVAMASALVWVLHPLNSEAVNYLTERTESLMGLFYLLTLYCSVRRWNAAAVIACALGMVSKESMVTAPVMVVLYDRMFVFDSLRDAFRARRGVYAALAATWLVLAGVLASRPRTSVGFEAGTSAWVYLLNQAEIVARYLWLSFWPRALVLDYGLPRALTPGDVVVPGLLVLALLAATIAALRYAPMAGFLGAWFFVTLSPTSSIVPIATEVGAERRMYLPLMAIVVGLVVLAGRGLLAPPRGAGKARATAFAAAVAVVCVLLATGTVLRNREYSSRLAMAQTIVERRPHGRAYFLLGSELVAAGRQQEAMAALRVSARDYAGARFALATELLAQGSVDEAIAELQAFLAAMPQHPTAAPARDLLGRAYLSQRRFAHAAEQYRILRETAPSYRGPDDDIQLNFAYALAGSGRLVEARTMLEQRVAARPGDAAARDLLTRVRSALSSTALTNPVN